MLFSLIHIPFYTKENERPLIFSTQLTSLGKMTHIHPISFLNFRDYIDGRRKCRELVIHQTMNNIIHVRQLVETIDTMVYSFYDRLVIQGRLFILYLIN